MSRRTRSRALIGVGLAVILWGVLGFTSASLGGPPEDLHFANRRSYTEVKRAAHTAFLPFLLRAGAGLGLLLLGAMLAGDTEDEPRS
ncbi:MAG: hypothetical protein MK297_00620 [Planctomycetes bacterium]|nr:hypothetical protein [Planctomycetota bacterium]